MRHHHGYRKLNRTSAHRAAMLRNMACSLITHEAIRTTLPKAKELRRVVEPLITLAKEPTVANKRLAFNRLRDRDVVVKLFNQVGPRFANRQGGYTRIYKLGNRKGDNAPVVIMELCSEPVAKKEKAEKPAEKPAKKAAAPKKEEAAEEVSAEEVEAAADAEVEAAEEADGAVIADDEVAVAEEEKKEAE